MRRTRWTRRARLDDVFANRELELFAPVLSTRLELDGACPPLMHLDELRSHFYLSSRRALSYSQSNAAVPCTSASGYNCTTSINCSPHSKNIF